MTYLNIVYIKQNDDNDYFNLIQQISEEKNISLFHFSLKEIKYHCFEKINKKK